MARLIRTGPVSLKPDQSRFWTASVLGERRSGRLTLRRIVGGRSLTSISLSSSSRTPRATARKTRKTASRGLTTIAPEATMEAITLNLNPNNACAHITPFLACSPCLTMGPRASRATRPDYSPATHTLSLPCMMTAIIDRHPAIRPRHSPTPIGAPNGIEEASSS